MYIYISIDIIVQTNIVHDLERLELNLPTYTYGLYSTI